MLISNTLQNISFFSMMIDLVLANTADSDEMSHSVASHQGLHCVLSSTQLVNSSRPQMDKIQMFYTAYLLHTDAY